jgi:Fe-S-cluster-containing dehydrogenase component
MSSGSKWTFIFDAAKCNGCNNCTMATRDEHVGNSFPGYSEEMPLHGHRWIDLQSRERGDGSMVDLTYFPAMCQHCEDPPCAKAAPPGAVRKRPDGIVIIDPERSKGARQMVDACPFGAIWWNEEKQVPQHWNFDAHLLDGGWKQPRCAQACPTGAMTARKIPDAEYDQLLEKGEAATLNSLSGKARVLYRGIEAMGTEFVGGTLVTPSGEGGCDCASGIGVVLLEGDKPVGEAISDAFGDFKIDDIDCQSLRRLRVVAGADTTIDIEVAKSVYLGRIVLPAPSPRDS